MTRLPDHRPLAAALAALLLAPASAPAQTAAWAGDWLVTTIDTPTMLREVYYDATGDRYRTSTTPDDYAREGELLVDVYYDDPIAVRTSALSLNSSGVASGDTTGQLVGVSGNRLTFDDGEGLFTLYANLSGDVLMDSVSEGFQQSLSLALRKPATLAAADLAGTWDLVAFLNPDNLTVNKLARVVDTYFVGDHQLTEGTEVVAANGTLSGLFPGTFTVTGNRSVTVSIPGENPVHFAVNASKNVLVASNPHPDEQEMILLVRRPATLSTAELAGTWRFTAVEVPTQLTESYYNSLTMTARQADSSGSAAPGEELVDVYHASDFALTRFNLQVDASGSFTGFGSGTMTANANRSVNVVIDGDTYVFRCNADKTVLIGGVVDPDNHALVVAVRTSASAAPTFARRVGLAAGAAPDGRLLLQWTGASNLRLQGTDGLGAWDDLPEADGADSFTIEPGTSPYRFFRVAEAP